MSKRIIDNRIGAFLPTFVALERTNQIGKPPVSSAVTHPGTVSGVAMWLGQLKNSICRLMNIPGGNYFSVENLRPRPAPYFCDPLLPSPNWLGSIFNRIG